MVNKTLYPAKTMLAYRRAQFKSPLVQGASSLLWIREKDYGFVVLTDGQQPRLTIQPFVPRVNLWSTRRVSMWKL